MSDDTVLGINPSISGKKWLWRQEASCTAENVSAMVQRHAIPEVLARILLARGIREDDDLKDYFYPRLQTSCPDPYSLQDMEKAAERLAQALCHREKVVVFGDYDVDGTTSCALLTSFFQACGRELIAYIPDRLKEGYGPNPQAFRHLCEQGVTLIVTVDCGTCAFEALEEASRRHVDVIIVDHHQISLAFPPCYALVNPQRADDNSGLKNLAAVGLTFMLVVAVNRLLRASGYYSVEGMREPNLMRWLDIVALGTVCDMVPLVGLNRIFVAQGLKSIAHCPSAGVKALFEVANLPSQQRPNVYHLGFTLGPRINAGGRLGDARMGFRLLTTACPKERAQLAQQLDALNFERQTMEKKMLEEALARVRAQDPSEEQSIIIVQQDNWHVGVLGIIASRLSALFKKPSLVISFDAQGLGKGSGRSVPGFNLASFIHEAVQKKYLTTGGGHAMAVGLSLHRDHYHDFCAFMLEKAAHVLKRGYVTPLMLDGLLALTSQHLSLLPLLEKGGPYGCGNPSPCFAFPRVRMLEACVVGGNHVRCLLYSDDTKTRLSSIAFHCATSPLGQWLLAQRAEKFFHIAGVLQKSVWQERERLQIMIEDAGEIL